MEIAMNKAPNQAPQRIVAVFPPRPAFGSRLRVTAEASAPGTEAAVHGTEAAVHGTSGGREMGEPSGSRCLSGEPAATTALPPISQVTWHHGRPSLSWRPPGVFAHAPR